MPRKPLNKMRIVSGFFNLSVCQNHMEGLVKHTLPDTTSRVLIQQA